MTREIANLLAVIGCVWCAGCNSKMDSSVQGTVTIDGQLANRGTVAFNPVGGGAPAYSSIAKDGSYSLRVGQGNLSNEDASKIRSGDYVVTVVINLPSSSGETMGEAGPPKPGPRITAEKYASKDTSPLHKTVMPGPNVMPLELEGASAAEEDKAPGDGKATNEHPQGAMP
jgi:hypothetical protein